MDYSSIFNKATNVMWQDFNAFKREYGYETPSFWSLLGSILLFSVSAVLTIMVACSGSDTIVLLIFTVPMAIGSLFGIRSWIEDYQIEQKVYDIEMGTKDILMIRNMKGKYGILDITRNKRKIETLKIILPMKYTMIQDCGNGVYILERNHKYGIYNVADGKIVIDVIQDKIDPINSENIVFNVYNGNSVRKFNCHGDRILL